jgi:hypothetical protein
MKLENIVMVLVLGKQNSVVNKCNDQLPPDRHMVLFDDRKLFCFCSQ